MSRQSGRHLEPQSKGSHLRLRSHRCFRQPATHRRDQRHEEGLPVFPDASQGSRGGGLHGRFARGSRILEPSCGNGALADVIWKVGGFRIERLLGIELNTDMNRYLAYKPYETVLGVDFPDYCRKCPVGDKWTHIIMNPPFSRQQDIDHIMAAYGILAPGGVLVSILSPSPFYRQNRKSQKFREWLDDLVADIVDVPPGALKESGTSIAAKIIKVVKPAA